MMTMAIRFLCRRRCKVRFDGSGGGLYCAYDSVVKVIDSIFWQNEANDGTQIQVGTGDEYAPHPTVLDILYSSVDDYPSSNAINEAYGSTANVDSTVAALEPAFEKLPDSDEKEIQFNYYLNQDTSDCKDAGSAFASVIGLNTYTTSILGGGDRGMVDLGYHYEQTAAKVACSYTDFHAPGYVEYPITRDGKVNLSDWAFFAYQWLSDTCSENQ